VHQLGACLLSLFLRFPAPSYNITVPGSQARYISQIGDLFLSRMARYPAEDVRLECWGLLLCLYSRYCIEGVLSETRQQEGKERAECQSPALSSDSLLFPTARATT
jgi:hypothetical protein